jgi:hypothetical protein
VTQLPLPELPDPDDAEAVWEFAMSFNGYEHFGSFDASSEAARSRQRRTIDDLRNELFFAARASRFGGADYMEAYRLIRPLIANLIRKPKAAG